MASLTISHVYGSNPAQFILMNNCSGKQLPAVQVISPYAFKVTDMGDASLMEHLRWYLEDFLQRPFPPDTDKAARIEQALKRWGELAFQAIFDNKDAGRWLSAGELHLQISSDDPVILSWPWEALYDPSKGTLAHWARVARRINYNLSDPPELSVDLPKDRINILLVTPRPYKNDVQYRFVSRALVEMVNTEPLPVSIDLLRPPTFDNLCLHLKQHPHHYHILHFDGHGGYGAVGNHNEGCLIFEDSKGKPHPVSATELTALLMDYAVPVVVLNACRSASLDEGAEAPTVSVAAALLKAGARATVAMAYSLYVKAAQEFLPVFYRTLFESGRLSEAVRQGRLKLLEHSHRTAINPSLRFSDWLVPVLYQQEEFDFSFAESATVSPKRASDGEVEPETALEKEDYVFVGRDGEILDFERALHRKPAGILIQGLGGIGKTTLAKACVRWLRDTNGLGNGLFWFGFDEIRSADYVINCIGRKLLFDQFEAGKHRGDLLKTLNENQFLIVWDNFESVRGIEGAEVTANLSQADQENLKDFLKQLRGGKTKILLTSRGQEKWLGGGQYVYQLPLRGLQPDEVWEYAAEILEDLGIVPDSNDAAFGELLMQLGGHPLLIRVVLLQLEDHSVAEVLSELKHNFSRFVEKADDAAHSRITGTLALLLDKIPEDQRDLLVPLALHEKFIAAPELEVMARKVVNGPDREQIDKTLASLIPAGLLHEVSPSLYQIHPLLSSFLREHILTTSCPERREAWSRAFVNFMSFLANYYASKEAHEQRGVFGIHNANFYHALRLAEELSMETEQGALLQALAIHAFNCSDYITAEKLCLDYASMAKKQGEGKEAAPYHLLGMIAQERHDFDDAEKWYKKSLAIKEKQGDEHGAAMTYYELGIIAEERRDFDTAEKWCKKSLAIKEKQGNEYGAANTYHLLGIIAEERRDFDTAEKWCKKSLAIKEKQGDEHGAAITYHQLGMIAQERHDFDDAEKWYKKSLAIKEKQGNEHYAAITYHQLGRIAEERRDFDTAEKWYKKSLAIEEKQGDEHGAAITYHQLGRIAEERHDFDTAEEWYKKALGIFEKQGNEHYAAMTYRQLGKIAQERHDFDDAEKWYKKSLAIEEKQGDEHGAAITYLQLGIIALLQKKLVISSREVVRSIIGFHHTKDEYLAGKSFELFVALYQNADTVQQTKMRKYWENAGLPMNIFEKPEHSVQQQKENTVPQVKFMSGEALASKEFSIPEGSETGKSRKQSYLYEVWYGTNRAPVMNGECKVTGYSNDRSNGPVYYGKCEVIIPESHQFGSTGSSWWKRWLCMKDDQLNMRGLSAIAEKQFWADISKYLSQIELNERISVVFLHGYNVSFQEAAIRTAQIGFDLKIPGAMAFFSWPSKAAPAAYTVDEDSIQASEDEISVFLSNFALQTGSQKVHIIAHSMGNRGLLRAIQRITHDAESRSGLKFGQIILAAPDVGVDLFKNLAELYPSVSDRTTLYVSAKDKAVALSRAVHGYDRVGFVPPVTVVPGIDTVEVTAIDLSLLGHGYIAEAEAVLYDMHDLIFHNTPPGNRTRLHPMFTVPASEKYWAINA